MKKTIIILIVSLLFVFTVACDKKEIDLDAQKLGDSLVQKIEFEDQITQIDSENAKDIYEIKSSEITVTSFIGSGATAEELTIFETSNKEKAKEIISFANKHIAEQKRDYESYNPKEIKKLDNAIVIQKDKYVIICVTEDLDAEKIINSSLK